MKDKIVLITGANSGIGKETATKLATKGASLVLACRDIQKANEAREEIIANTGNTRIETMSLDLASFTSIRTFATEFNKRYESLDVLINNAGLMKGSRFETEDGLELTMGVNHFGTFLLTMLLLDRLKESAPSRIITVSSNAHEYGTIDFDDLQSTKNFEGRAYANSKLANILFTYELARKLQSTGVTANCLHPGMVQSSFYDHPESIEEKERYDLLRPNMISVEEGALTSIYLASSPVLEGVTGKYFDKCKEASSSALSYDIQTAKRLWETSLRVVSLDLTS
ncbi:SDR family oxidoreductase [Paenibacillus donghaensis]|uniref:Short-chain dehydrogenase n=1 Tax=Paenibacillus donghaensis TaxID=414771 RepID=A0A2Z2KC85_9BACL|nr:SDR family oxidoreductase [Paenibacillus donghaensis]ASA23444.1 hypothetical protein B9T62_23125 [Paenibacillus donghaensis]